MLYFLNSATAAYPGWHIGDPIPFNLPRVVLLQADGDELDLILEALKSTCKKEKTIG